jgi:hypothetical protein
LATEAHVVECEVGGLFLLDESDLRELDEILTAAWKEMRGDVSRRIRVEAKKCEPEMSISEGRKQISRLYPYRFSEREITLHCDSGTKIEGETFSQVTASARIRELRPTRASVAYRRADTVLKIGLLSDFMERNKITIEATPKRAVMSRIESNVRGWAESKRHASWWNVNVFGVLIAGWLLFMVSVMLFGIAKDQHGEKHEISHRASQLLNDGIAESEIAEALELLLRSETGIYGAVGEPMSNMLAWMFFVGAVALVIFALMRPRSLIGIGKTSRRLKCYRFLTRHASATAILGLIGTILVSGLGSAGWEFVRQLLSGK